MDARIQILGIVGAAGLLRTRPTVEPGDEAPVRAQQAV